MHAQEKITETFGSNIQVQYILYSLSTHSKVYVVIRYRLHFRSRHLETAPILHCFMYVIWGLMKYYGPICQEIHITWVYCVYMTKWEIESKHNNLWNTTPGPHLIRIHLVRYSTSARYEKYSIIHLVRLIIHLVRIFALSTSWIN